MSPRALLSRIAAMDREQIRFRTICATRKAAGRVRFAAAPPAWHRHDLAGLLDPAAGSAIRDARAAAARGDFLEAHRRLAQHFESRQRRWPVAAIERSALTSAIRDGFPGAALDSGDRADRIVEGRFDLLGYRDVPVGNPPDWHADAVHRRRAPRGFWASVPYLDPASGDHKVIWEVNRHQYFTTLGAAYWLTGRDEYRETFVSHLEDWLRRNPPLDGVNWASMLELAFRALSWTWAVEFFSADAAGDDVPWLVDLLVALDRQLAHIEHNLSTYFSPNTHLSGEALALYAVSLAFPELRASRARAARGREILLREASAQILEDGGHVERSSHYHRYSTEFYLLALLVARQTADSAAPDLERAVRAQAAYLRTIADDRGRLPGIGDDDGGQLFAFGIRGTWDVSSTLSALASALDDDSLAVAQPDAEVCWILGEPLRKPAATNTPACWPSRVLDASGYFVSRGDRGHLVFDAGPHGFLNGGHAHADALSVVLTVDGIPLLVDPGTATYTMDPGVRDRFRSAAMHNAVTIDGRGFAEPRGPFHWARTVDAQMLAARTGPDGDFAVGVHHAYGFPHARAVLTLPASGWLIVDVISSPAPVTVETWWHLHPSWTAAIAGGGFALTHSSGSALALATTAVERSVEVGPAYSAEYGRVDSGSVLRTAISASGPVVSAAFVPTQAACGRCPVLTIVGKESAPGGEWTTWTVGCESDSGETRVTIVLPGDLRTQREPADWPQPCIRELRASCVE
jgi:Heparinase II/III-like protein/Heparinase II/III N-terminus